MILTMLMASMFEYCSSSINKYIVIIDESKK